MADAREFMTKYYQPVHGPLVLSICVFGISSQALNIVVLTRPPMRAMPINVLLMGLSVAQLVLLTNYALNSTYALLDRGCMVWTKSYASLAYLLFNVNVNAVFHTIALAHTTLLAVFRYAAVAYPVQCRKMVSKRGASVATCAAFLGVPLLCASFYANSVIVRRSPPELNLTNPLSSSSSSSPSPDEACPHWTPVELEQMYALRYTENRTLRDYNFVFFGSVCKLLPCVLMICLSLLLLRELRRFRQRRQRMTKRSAPGDAERNSGQTTAMLVTVVMLLVAVELPQGLLNLLSATSNSYNFSDRVYAPLGDFFEMLTVLYSSVNFVICCTMSSKFRTMFKAVLSLEAAADRFGKATYRSSCSQENAQLIRHGLSVVETQNSCEAPGTVLSVA